MYVSLSHYRNLLSTYLRPQRSQVMLLAILLFSSIGLQLVNPQIVRTFIDTTQRGGPERTLLLAAGLFVAIALLQRGLALAAVYVSENVGWSATNALRADLTLHCLQLDMPFHKEHTPGELIERIDGDVTSLANFFSQLIVQVLGNGLLILGILLLLLREDWRVGIGLSVYTLVTFLLLRAVQNVAVARWAASRQASAEHYGFLEERISGTEDIRGNGGEPYVMHRLYRLMGTLLQAERSARLVSNITYISTNFLFVIGYALGLGLGAYLYTQGQVSIGTAYLVVFYIGMLSAPLESIRTQVQDLQQATASIGRVDRLLRMAPAVQERLHVALPNGPLGAAFENVTFGYDGGEPVLQNVSFALHPGRVLGLLGRSGSGKTTLTRLLFRLYDPAVGTIRLGGVDIRDVSLDDLRGRVGMVTQDVQLFHASIRDNLTFFNRRVTDDQIIAVLRELGLWVWVESLPAGLDTELGAGGQGLSAGEAQLLAFARVFLKHPGLVILDEASSRLDPASEQLLEQAVNRLMGGDGGSESRPTGIIIAHRLQTVLRADAIMILEGGRVLEYGSREALLRDPNSHFNRLLQTGLEEVFV